MSTATDYHTGLLPGFAPIGRRIEVLLHPGPASTVELVAKSRANLGRLMFTFDTARFAKSWRMASHHWKGDSLFIYDGHSVSTRCPGCANLGHFFTDDLFMSLLAMLETGVTVNRTVSNLLATEGRRPVKNFQLDVLRSVFNDLELMGPDEVHCFENVRIAVNAKKVNAETLQDREFYKPWGVSTGNATSLQDSGRATTQFHHGAFPNPSKIRKGSPGRPAERKAAQMDECCGGCCNARRYDC